MGLPPRGETVQQLGWMPSAHWEVCGLLDVLVMATLHDSRQVYSPFASLHRFGAGWAPCLIRRVHLRLTVGQVPVDLAEVVVVVEMAAAGTLAGGSGSGSDWKDSSHQSSRKKEKKNEQAHQMIVGGCRQGWGRAGAGRTCHWPMGRQGWGRARARRVWGWAGVRRVWGWARARRIGRWPIGRCVGCS